MIGGIRSRAMRGIAPTDGFGETTDPGKATDRSGKEIAGALGTGYFDLSISD